MGILDNRTIRFRINTVLKTTIEDGSVTLGKINANDFGVVTNGLYYSTFVTAWSDGGNALVGVILDSIEDEYKSKDTYEDQLNSGDSFYSEHIHLIPTENIIDSFCDKFYWKKTAERKE